MFTEILQHEVRCTKSEEKIREFIEEHTEEFLFMSIGQLAEKLSISEATVSRFARHLGYKDFKGLKSAVGEKKAGRGPARKIAEVLLKDQGFDKSRWFEYQKECIDITDNGIEYEDFHCAIEKMCNAKKIYIHGKNASGAIGQLLFYRLRRMGIDVILIPSGGSEVIEGIAHADSNDLVVLFSFSKVSEEGKIILDIARKNNVFTLVFSGRKYVPADERGDINIYVYRGEKDEFHSMTAAVALIDGIIIALSERMSEQTAENLQKIHELKEHYRKRFKV